MKLASFSSARRGVVTLATAVALAGCGTAAPTARIVFVTATPNPTPIVIYVTPTPTATATPAASAAATAAASGSASPASAAAACTGTAANKAFFVEAAANLPFDVYCGVMPSGWWLESAEYQLPGGGHLDARYKNAAGAEIDTREGHFCTAPTFCAVMGSPAGSASFGGLSGTLFVVEPYYSIVLPPPTDPRYWIVGHGMGRAKFLQIAAAFVRVPRP